MKGVRAVEEYTFTGIFGGAANVNTYSSCRKTDWMQKPRVAGSRLRHSEG